MGRRYCRAYWTTDGTDHNTRDTNPYPSYIACSNCRRLSELPTANTTATLSSAAHAVRHAESSAHGAPRRMSEEISSICDYKKLDTVCKDVNGNPTEMCEWNLQGNDGRLTAETGLWKQKSLFPAYSSPITTVVDCQALCDATSDCHYILVLTSCKEDGDFECTLHSEYDAPGWGTIGTQPGAPGGFHGCSSWGTTTTDRTAREYARTCSLAIWGGISTHFEFGDVDEQTSDIAINFLDSDRYPDVITSSARGHVRIYRGTANSLRTGDFSNTLPETMAEIALINNVTQRRLLFGAYSRFPGDARDARSLPNVQQIFVRDFDQNGRNDLFLHAPALSPGSCAQRCHSLGRFGARQPHLYTLLGP